MVSPRYGRRRAPRIVPAIIAINVVVFLGWAFFGRSGIGSEVMEHNFLVSWTGLFEGRIWTLVTSAFSHNLFWHLLLNMFVLNSFGRIVEDALGSVAFLKFYIVAGLVSSLSHALVSALLLSQPELPALGASGAISGVILLFALIFPKQRILIFGLIPVPALWGAAFAIGLDLWGLSAQAHGGGLPLGHGAHLGGAAAGIVYYFLVWKRRVRSPESFL